MRVLFTVSSWATHYSSMVPLGWALQSVGHEVRVLCPPSQVDPIAGAGLFPVPVLDGMDVVTSNRLQYYFEAVDGIWPYPWLPLHPLTGAQLGSLKDFDVEEYRARVAPEFAERAGRSFDAAVEYADRWRADIVLHDPASLEGLLVARVLGLRSALCLWGPVGTHEAEHMRIVPTDLSGAFPRYGLGRLSLDMIEYVVDPCPEAVAPPTQAARMPVRYEPYNGCAPVPAWLLDRPERPRVCVVWSTALSTMSGPNSYLLPELIQAAGELDVEVLVTATDEDIAALGPVPETVRVLRRMPLRLVLPTCAAVVHHGGSGNTMTSLWAGVPQLTVTFASEQTVAGERIAAAGAGMHLLGHLADRTAVRSALAELLSARAYREAATALRDEMRRRPTMADLVGTLAELVAGPAQQAVSRR